MIVQWYLDMFVTPLYEARDLPPATRRKFLLGVIIPPLCMAMLLIAAFNMAFVTTSSCTSPLLFGAAVQVCSASVILGLYIFVRITQSASDGAFFFFIVVMLVDGAITGLQFPVRPALMGAMFDVFPLAIFLAAITAGWRKRGIWSIMFMWFVFLSLAAAAVCFTPHDRAVFSCNDTRAPFIVACFMNVAVVFGTLLLAVFGDYYMQAITVKTNLTTMVLKDVCEHLSQCDTVAASELLQRDAEEAEVMPAKMREMLQHLVDRLHWYSRFINPTMADELRAATMTAGTISRTDEAHDDNGFGSQSGNPLSLDAGDSGGAGALDPNTPNSVAASARVSCHTGAIAVFSITSGFTSMPHMFADIVGSVEEGGGSVLSVTFSEIVAVWTSARTSTVDNNSSSSSTGNRSGPHSDGGSRDVAVATRAAEAVTRTVTERWKMPDLRAAICLGEVWGGAFGSLGRQRVFFLGGQGLRDSLSLPSLCQCLGVRVVVTHGAAVHLENRCMPVDLIRLQSGSEQSEPVYTLLLGLASREFGNREVRARNMILQGIFERLVAGGPSLLPEVAASLRAAARGDALLEQLIRRMDDAVKNPDAAHFSALSRRHDPFVRVPTGHGMDSKPLPDDGDCDDDVSADGSAASELTELMHTAHGDSNATGVTVRGHHRPLKKMSTSSNEPSGPNEDTQSSGSTHSVGSMLSHWQRTRYETGQEAQGLFEMYTEADDKLQADVPAVVVDNGGREWRRSKKVLGQGAFSEVYAAVGVYGQPVALKCIDLTSPKVSAAAAEVAAEVETMKGLRHRNVVGYISHALISPYLVLVMESVTAGSLRHLLQLFGKLPVDAVKRYIRDAVQGVQYLHDNNVTHCDIKPHNLLLTGSGMCKVADFGSAVNRSILHGALATSTAEHTLYEAHLAVNGTPLYMSPEACRGESANPRDIWSIGVTTLELLTGRLKWNDEMLVTNSVRFVQRLGKDETLMLLIDEDLPEEAKAFVTVCLHRDPEKRPTAAGLLTHPFLTVPPAAA